MGRQKRSDVGQSGTRWIGAADALDVLLGICNATPDIVATRGAQGELTFLNKAGREFLGLGQDQSLEGGLDRCLHPEWAAKLVIETALPAAARDGAWSGESAIQTPDGREIPVSQFVIAHKGADGEVDCFSTILRDVSAIKRTQSELHESQRLIHNVADATLDLLFILELPSRRILYANRRFEEVLGVPRESGRALDTEYLATIVHPQDLSALVRSMEAAATLSDDCVRETEIRVRSDNGAWRWLNIRSTVFERDAELEVVRVLSTAHDVTSRVRADAEERELRRVMENALEGVARLDCNGRYVYANHAYAEMSGVSAEEIVGLGWDGFVHPFDRAEMASLHARVAKEGRVLGECRGQRSDGTVYFKQIVLIATYTLEREFTGYYCFASDVTDRRGFELQMRQQMQALTEYSLQLETKSAELRDANRRLESLASNDGLTGVPNHRTMQDRLRQELSAHERDHRPVSFLLLDIDHFKAYNDAFGHPEGDEVLRMFAAILTGTARTADIVARYGGEEFAVILPNTGAGTAKMIAERLRGEVEGHPWALRPITASIGISSTETLLNPTPGALVETADRALYEAKRAGRNRVCVAGGGHAQAA